MTCSCPNNDIFIRVHLGPIFFFLIGNFIIELCSLCTVCPSMFRRQFFFIKSCQKIVQGAGLKQETVLSQGFTLKTISQTENCE